MSETSAQKDMHGINFSRKDKNTYTIIVIVTTPVTSYPTQLVLHPWSAAMSAHGRQIPSGSRRALIACTVRVEAVACTLVRTMTALKVPGDMDYIPAVHSTDVADEL